MSHLYHYLLCNFANLALAPLSLLSIVLYPVEIAFSPVYGFVSCSDRASSVSIVTLLRFVALVASIVLILGP